MQLKISGKFASSFRYKTKLVICFLKTPLMLEAYYHGVPLHIGLDKEINIIDTDWLGEKLELKFKQHKNQMKLKK